VKWFAIVGLTCCVAVASIHSEADTQSVGRKHVEKPQPPLSCGDYLKQFGFARPEVQFLGCRSVLAEAPRVPGFEATYRVRGKDIDAVDNWLATWAEWERLRFSCCQWDAPRGFYKDKQGSNFEVNMFAEAYISGHMVDQRKDFSKLPYATLTISHYLQ